MDNQFNQPGGGMPLQGTSSQPPMGYPGAAQPPYAAPNPYDAIQPQAPSYGAQQPPFAGMPYDTMQQQPVPFGAQQPYAPGNPYDALQPQASPYGAQQPYAPNPYDTMQQPVNAYGAVQQPYADPGAQQQPYSEDGYEHLFGREQGQGVPEQPVPRQVHGQPFAGAAAPQIPGRRKRMNPSDIALIVVGMLAVIGFAAWFLYSNYAPQAARIGRVETGSLSAIHSGNVLVVRNEIPFDAEGVNSIMYEAKEGSKVARNAVICYVYSTGYSASAVRQLQEFRDEIRDYQESLIESSTIYDAKSDRYNGDVLALAQQMRSLIAGEDGSLPNIEAQMTQVVAERQTYFDKKYASDQRFSRKKDDERSQNQRISSWMLSHTANSEALVSFYSDGFEYAINGGNYTGFEPNEVRAMINGRKPENAAPAKGRTTIYRLVKDNEWYALFLSDDTEWNPVVGETYELQLERFGDTPVTASVVSFTKSGGELLVRLRISGSVQQVMYLRSCGAVLSESMSTLMVNERAIHTRDDMTGVTVVDGSTESFIPVNVIHVLDGYAYFQTVQQSVLFEGMEVRLYD